MVTLGVHELVFHDLRPADAGLEDQLDDTMAEDDDEEDSVVDEQETA